MVVWTESHGMPDQPQRTAGRTPAAPPSREQHGACGTTTPLRLRANLNKMNIQPRRIARKPQKTTSCFRYWSLQVQRGRFGEMRHSSDVDGVDHGRDITHETTILLPFFVRYQTPLLSRQPQAPGQAATGVRRPAGFSSARAPFQGMIKEPGLGSATGLSIVADRRRQAGTWMR